uniref:Uncharacterized protein n=1 Tax=Anguilla anguilla TaxID=7936 RepID=A0A0E9WBZ9_ANGAN
MVLLFSFSNSEREGYFCFINRTFCLFLTTKYKFPEQLLEYFTSEK